MGGWTEDTLLKFMQVHSEHFGEEVLQVEAAKQEWICKKFTERLFGMLDWTQTISSPYVLVSFVGKGDIESIKVKEDFCLNAHQCAKIANFITCKMHKDDGRSRINELDSFAVINYIQHDINLRTDYIGLLRRVVDK